MLLIDVNDPKQVEQAAFILKTFKLLQNYNFDENYASNFVVIDWSPPINFVS